jgi:hypothetical protein
VSLASVMSPVAIGKYEDIWTVSCNCVSKSYVQLIWVDLYFHMLSYFLGRLIDLHSPLTVSQIYCPKTVFMLSCVICQPWQKREKENSLESLFLATCSGL